MVECRIGAEDDDHDNDDDDNDDDDDDHHHHHLNAEDGMKRVELFTRLSED